MSMEGSSNIRKEAENLGVTVKAEKTFLTFDKENAVENRRRFTTTDLVMDKELVQKLRSLSEEEVSAPAGLTTVMVRNVPNKYSQDALIEMVRKMGFRFNFFYAPMDARTLANCGYFFMNLVSPEEAEECLRRFNGLQLPAARSRKVCTACWARIQGYSANVQSLPPVGPREFSPRIFNLDGQEVDENSLSARKVFVGGLAPSTDTRTIEAHLAQFGRIEDVSILLDSNSKSSRGFAFVTFETAAAARACVEAKHLHFIDGRSLGIRPYTKCRNSPHLGLDTH